MDYKYINQLLERYWNCETTLEEEEILRAFFSQEDVPAELQQYSQLFAYEAHETKNDHLGEDFDNALMEMIGEESPRKQRRTTFSARLMPLFRAAAIVAIVLTLGNAMQMSFEQKDVVYTGFDTEISTTEGESVALGDTATIDSMQQSSVVVPLVEPVPMIK